jgi:hypothetical protein
MEQAMSDLAAPDLMAACLSVMAPTTRQKSALHSTRTASIAPR